MKIKCFSVRKYWLLVFFFISPIGMSQGQESLEPQDELVTNIFNYGVIINGQTTETTPKGAFELLIQHRFGELDLKDFGNTVVKEFLGFDGSANIRFGFTFAISDRLQVGIGRTKIDKVYDFEGKYKLLRQKEKGTPISITLYTNMAISTLDFAEIGPNEFFSDLETPFENKFSHRLSYGTQILISRKFSENFSLEFNPTFIYKNLIPENNENFIFGATLGGRLKTGITSSLIFEFTTKFNNRINDFTDPLAIGYEIGTAGHAFQMFIASTNQIIPQNIYFSDPLDYTDGKLLIGFNIKRTFWKNENN